MKTINIRAIFLVWPMLFFAPRILAQDTARVKPSTLIFQVFYNDFPTAQLIGTTSLNNALNSGQWKRVADMQMGLGFCYMKGINRHLDILGVVNTSYTDYLFKTGTTNGSSAFLLDAGLGLNTRLLNDDHIFSPFLSTGASASFYQGKTGFYIPAGIGLQANIFHQAFALLNLQYRKAVGGFVNDHFHYNIGIGFSIGHKKTKPTPSGVKLAPVIDTPVAKKPVELPRKNLIVLVKDVDTGLPLPGVAVIVKSADTLINLSTDSYGQADAAHLRASNYQISGKLNHINTDTARITTANFNTISAQLNIELKHNDPRFTLSGNVENIDTGKPESGVIISVLREGNNATAQVTNRDADGSFSIQLEPGSDFTVSGKKAGYISDIQKLSTRGLSRSTILYVKLKLSIQQTQVNKAIVLNQIYYDTGSAEIKAEASDDLEKLVRFMTDNPFVHIEIDSHTDSRGSKALNARLSQARANAVVTYLVNHGIDKKRMVAKGLGAAQPVNGCLPGVKCSEAEYAKNRRTEFKVVQ